MSFYNSNCDLESLRCGLSERVCNTIGILITTALTVSGISCLVVGLVCFNTGGWVSNKAQCESIYITGILMSFIIGIIVVFSLFICLIEYCEKRATPVTVRNPVRRRLESIDEENGRGRKNSSPKLSAKKKNSPLQTLEV